MGRKPKLLNNNTKNIILNYISKGNYISTACHAAGIHYTTFANWQKWANEYAMNPDDGNEHKKIYFDFFEELKNAEAEAEAVIVSRIHDAGADKRNWPANMTMLERKYPERWGRRDVLEVKESKVLVALRERFQSLRNESLNQIEEQKQLPPGDTK